MFGFFPEEHEQKLRIKRFLMAFGSYVMWLCLCAICVKQGLSRYTTPQLFVVSVLIMLMHLTIYFIFRTGLNKRFKDPSLTMFQMMMATVWIMACLYGAIEIRGSMLMLYFVVYIFGVFRLRFIQFLILSLFALINYSFVVYFLLKFHPNEVNLKVELINILFLATVLPWFSLIGSYITNLRLKITKAFERIEQLAVTDELTQVFNRRRLLEILKEQKALCDRSDHCFCICIFDLDHFKSVNDNYGHEAGDIVLKTVSTVIDENIRDIDCLARYGGEEFMLVLTHTQIREAMVFAERVRELTEDIRFEGMDDLSITISMGVTEYTHSESVQTMINRADTSLYQAKSNGRNRVELGEKVESKQMYLF